MPLRQKRRPKRQRTLSKMRFRRKDKYRDEAIELLDAYYEKAGHDLRTAYSLLDVFSQTFITTEIERCVTDCRYYAENHHCIATESEGIRTLNPFWDSQEIFYDVVLEEQKKTGKVKICVLKARQLGQSTVSEALIFHKTIFTEACNSLVVAQDPDQTDYLFNMSRTAYECLPWWMRPECRYDAKGNYLIFDRKRPEDRVTNPGLRSQILCQASNKACLCPGTQVLTFRGMVSIENIVPGDFVFGPNCKPVKVVAALRKLAPNKTGRKIIAWYNAGFPISGTCDHPLVTSTGLRGMEEIKKGDHLILPFRKIVSGGKIPEPRMSRHAYVRLKNRPSPQPNREWGFLCGLYLSEGSIEKSNGRAVSFSLYL